MTKPLGAIGYFALGAGHVAGMIDMVALPLWVGALIANYGFGPAHAGGAVTMFLFSVVLASALVEPQFARLPHKVCVAGGFGLAAASFFALSRLPVDASNFLAIAGLHALAGFSVGCALSITHGAIGRTSNPHRLFGMVNVALGVVGVITFATVPGMIANVGAQSMFMAFAGVMGIACLISAAAFPAMSSAQPEAALRRAPLPAAAWLVIFVVICMTFNQAMVFSFLEQLGLAHGFSQSSINGVLIALGFVNLLPGGLAALLQKRLSPLGVGFAGPVAQAILALTLSFSTSFLPFAAAGAVFVSVVIFTHTFLFGLLSRLDTSGRAVAATPAMMMIGSSTGPAVGGLIVSTWGYQGIGVAAAFASCTALVLLGLLRLQLRARPTPLATAPG